MKKIAKIFIVAAAAFFATEATADAQILKNLLNKVTGSTTETTTTTETVAETTPTTNGKTAGVALKSLYTQYKADGKLDMSNLNNLLNLTSLANSIKGLKGQSNKGTFYKEFAEGLILGSDNLVSSTNSTSVMSGLTNLVNNVDLSGLTEKAETTQEKATNVLSTVTNKTSSAIENASEIANSVTNILNLFKK